MAFRNVASGFVMMLNLDFRKLTILTKDDILGTKQIALNDLAREFRVGGNDVSPNKICRSDAGWG